jgi:hypothetical protein
MLKGYGPLGTKIREAASATRATKHPKARRKLSGPVR